MDASQQRVIDQKLMNWTAQKIKPASAQTRSRCLWQWLAAAAAEYQLPLYRYLGAAMLSFAARAHDEHPQRGVTPITMWTFRIHGDARGRGDVFGCASLGASRFPHLKACLGNAATTPRGDEGGFRPSVKSNVEAHELILRRSSKAGYKPGDESPLPWIPPPASFIKMANMFSRNPTSPLRLRKKWSATGLSGARLSGSVDRGWSGGDDWEGCNADQRTGGKIQLVGRRSICYQYGASGRNRSWRGNSILIKSTRSARSARLSMPSTSPSHGYTSIISHRSGEPKTHSSPTWQLPRRRPDQDRVASPTDRVAKYNRLLRVEEELGDSGEVLGLKALNYKQHYAGWGYRTTSIIKKARNEMRLSSPFTSRRKAAMKLALWATISSHQAGNMEELRAMVRDTRCVATSMTLGSCHYPLHIVKDESFPFELTS